MKKKILLIEDDATMRENTAEILELAQFEIAAAENGRSGVQLAKEWRPDLIICDIMMPVLDGYGVLHLLSKDPETASIPFIFLTAKAEKSEFRKGMELGADDYITKPFEEMELLNAIESRLRKSELLQKKFAQTLEGLNQFLDEAKGLNALETLSQKRPLVRYKKKEILFHEGDRPQNLFFLHRGMVKTYKSNDEGKEYVTSIAKAGEFFGYTPLLENTPYADSAVTLEESEVCKIPKEDFLALIYKNRDVATAFIKMLSNHVTEREKQLLSLAYDTVRKRVADALLVLEKRYRTAGRAHTHILMSREDMAGMTGTTTETVIRCLSDFKTDKFIEVAGREIVVLDLKGLQNIQ